MWVADSAADLATLESTNSALTAGRDTSPMATSPVVLAVRTDDAAAVTAAGLSWQTLPAATGPNGSVILPSGQHLVVALPDPITNRATSYALQSVVAARTGGTVDAAGVTALRRISRHSPVPHRGRPRRDRARAIHRPVRSCVATDDQSDAGVSQQPATTEEALTQLAAGTSAFTAVPVVESDLVAFTATTPGLSAISPSGSAVGDTVYAVPLTAAWINPTLEDASALFLAYLRGPGGDQAFTDNGFLVAGSPPGGSAESDAATPGRPHPAPLSRRPSSPTRARKSPPHWRRPSAQPPPVDPSRSRVNPPAAPGDPPARSTVPAVSSWGRRQTPRSRWSAAHPIGWTHRR